MQFHSMHSLHYWICLQSYFGRLLNCLCTQWSFNFRRLPTLLAILLSWMHHMHFSLMHFMLDWVLLQCDLSFVWGQPFYADLRWRCLDWNRWALRWRQLDQLRWMWLSVSNWDRLRLLGNRQTSIRRFFMQIHKGLYDKFEYNSKRAIIQCGSCHLYDRAIEFSSMDSAITRKAHESSYNHWSKNRQFKLNSHPTQQFEFFILKSQRPESSETDHWLWNEFHRRHFITV